MRAEENKTHSVFRETSHEVFCYTSKLKTTKPKAAAKLLLTQTRTSTKFAKQQFFTCAEKFNEQNSSRALKSDISIITFCTCAKMFYGQNNISASVLAQFSYDLKKRVFEICFISQYVKVSNQALLVYPLKISLIWKDEKMKRGLFCRCITILKTECRQRE